MKFATKHFLLTTAISVHSLFSIKAIAKTLGIYHRNVFGVILRWKFIDDNGKDLWSLTIKKKRANGLFDIVKKIIINWWACETRISPNKKDVTQRKPSLVFMKKSPTHYLMETHLPLFSPPMLHFSVFFYLIQSRSP